MVRAPQALHWWLLCSHESRPQQFRPRELLIAQVWYSPNDTAVMFVFQPGGMLVWPSASSIAKERDKQRLEHLAWFA